MVDLCDFEESGKCSLSDQTKEECSYLIEKKWCYKAPGQYAIPHRDET